MQRFTFPYLSPRAGSQLHPNSTMQEKLFCLWEAAVLGGRMDVVGSNFRFSCTAVTHLDNVPEWVNQHNLGELRFTAVLQGKSASCSKERRWRYNSGGQCFPFVCKIDWVKFILIGSNTPYSLFKL